MDTAICELINRLNGRADAAPSPTERRRGGRLRIERLRCELGEVLDLSPTGARVLAGRFRNVPQGLVLPALRFRAGGAVTIPVRARVARSSSVGTWRREVGLQFEELDDAQREMLSELGRVHSVRRRLPVGRAAA